MGALCSKLSNVCVSPRNGLLFAGANEVLNSIDFAKGEIVRTQRHPDAALGQITALALSPKETFIAVGFTKGAVVVYSLNEDEEALPAGGDEGDALEKGELMRF